MSRAHELAATVRQDIFPVGGSADAALDELARMAANAEAAEAERLRGALKQLHRRFGHHEFCDCCTCIDVRAAIGSGLGGAAA